MIETDFLTIVASKDEVLACDTQAIVGTLRRLIASPEDALAWRERVDFAIHGYNDSQWELFEIEEVRNFIYKLDDDFPYWLFFLSKHGLGLQCIAHCFFPPFLTPEARATAYPEAMDSLLTRRWFPAMNQICAWVGMTESAIEAMTDRSVKYLLIGPSK